MSDFLTNLNQQQRTAVEYLDGPLLVVAGPGTGKTRVITHRLAHRLAAGAPAERMLGITFTTRAAQEMRARVKLLVGDDVPVRIGTFHWMGHALLRRNVQRIGLSPDFRLLTPAESRNALKGVVSESWPGEQAALRRLQTAITAVKNGAPLDLAARRSRLTPEVVSAVREGYDRALRNARSMDLDDLVYLSVRLLREDEAAQQAGRSWYREIVVDEFQDTNPIQRELLTFLASPEGSIVAVGDEDQAIYGWRQADGQGMRRFLEDFPSARIIRLNESYRSTKRILRTAGALIAHNAQRLGVHLRTHNPAGELPVCLVGDDEMEEAELIAAEIVRLTGRGDFHPTDLAVLFRINAQSRVLEEALVRHRIPYHVHAGTRFYERPEIRRVVSYLRLALDDDDDAAAWLASEVPGIGQRRLQHLRELGAGRQLPLLRLLDAAIAGAPRASLARLQCIVRRVDRLRAARDSPLQEIVSAAIAVAQEDADIAATPDAESALENLEELRSVARELGPRHTTLHDFVDRVTLAYRDQGRGGVSLMTLHASKGLEFSVVFIAGVEEGLLPHRRSLERDEIAEERRLCYVGMTRARSRLYLSYAHGRMLGDRQTLGDASMFISEMGAANLRLQFSARRAAKPRLSSVRVGEKVMHPRWGVGTVTAVEGSGRDTLTAIQFEAAGRQRLQLCHAPLTRVGQETSNVRAG